MRSAFTVYIVDDDAPIRDALGQLLALRGYRVAPFASAESFLAAWRPEWTGCLMTDLRLPGLSGLDLQHALKERGASLPVIVITGHGDVGAARTAFRSDAVDFLEKPFDDDAAVAAIEMAFEREAARLSAVHVEAKRSEAWNTLTHREREVARLVVQGAHNKEIASRLGISPRTVEIHRARVMEKSGARTLADLIRMAGSAVE
jgi:FixJ family two-component response regulator